MVMLSKVAFLLPKAAETMKPRVTGLQKPCDILSPLREFMGAKTASRVDVNKAIWSHIKLKNLQDPSNKREILPDATLQRVLGVDKINMFEMNKVLTKFIKQQGATG
ncbi:Dna topoisomerase domain-containing protein [Cardiosporidium cionae]|uniref:Dna topoisomerase domain-containing protein n=1 Tax=Cardiosporidium cionae TaxID=476202 RepID=A0ABQ7J3Y2_9APIC|nr:Dna topoisomerase domain-containing protein [Cardiosporidium cionae]|eukprot:KAF8817822.1 Dna topoisomerase domain-containing protein [Cardiosporidium cionae]